MTLFEGLQVTAPGDSVRRTLGDVLFAGAVNVTDYGADKTGVADSLAAFQRALAAARTVLVPAGEYKLSATLEVPQGKVLRGEHGEASFFTGTFAGPLLTCNPDAEETSRVLIEDIGLKMTANTTAGILNYGHLAVFTRIHAWGGGNASAWAIDMVDSNECVIDQFRAGPPGMPATFTANGIRFRNSDPENNAVNYGDSQIIQPIIRLWATNLTGILLDGGEHGNYINNVDIYRVQVIAPQSGSTPYAGTVGVHLKHAARNRIFGGGFEAIATGVRETGGNGSPARENQLNAYMGIYAINVTTPYADTNGSIATSVQRRTFMGCGNDFPSLAGKAGAAELGSNEPLCGSFWVYSTTDHKPAWRFGQEGNDSECYITDGDFGSGADGSSTKGGAKIVVSGNNVRYEPSDSGSGDIRMYLGREANMRAVVTDTQHALKVFTAEPASPLANSLVIADGATWDPGSGAGLYIRNQANNAWVFLVAT